MKKLFFLSIAFIGLSVCITSNVSAQGVGINPSGTPPDPSAMFDVSSTTKGTLITRMTTSQRDAILNPAEGLVIYNTDCKTFNFNAGSPSLPNWVTLNSSNAVIAGVAISANPTGAVCAGVNVTFTAVPTNGGLTPAYQWKVNGGNVGTNSSTYSSSSLNNGDVVSCVLTSNASCVSGSPATSNTVTVLVNAAPTITGTTPTATCGAGTVTLGATPSAGIVNWFSAPSGGFSLGTGTSFTTSISATTTFYAEATFNGCTSLSRTGVTATVYSSAPAQPGTISGLTTNLGGGTAVSYSIAPVAFATSYSWTVPSGATLTGGQSTTAITVDYGCSASGSISVFASNVCGSSSTQSLNVSTTLTNPGNVAGPNFILANATGKVYSIVPVAGFTYNWSVPSGATITSNSGSSITVNFGSSPSGNITVSSTNSCGTSGLSSAPIYALASPLTVNATGTGANGIILNFEVPAGTTSLTIEAWGAGGGYGDDRCGSNNTSPGKGARMKGTFTVTPGQVLKILVGQQGKSILDNNPCSSAGGGGGGGTFITDVSNNPLIVAGGGGGENWDGFNVNGVDALTTNSGTGGGATAGRAGSGGGLLGNGTDYDSNSKGGLSFANGGTGGIGQNNEGGFGGGGGSLYEGAGGGGYTGGGVITTNSYNGPQPTGAGSYNGGTSQSNSAGVQAGNGQVILTW